MFEAVESLIDEHADVERRLADPSVHGDARLARDLGRRYAQLTAVVRAYREWQQAVDDLVAAQELHTYATAAAKTATTRIARIEVLVTLLRRFSPMGRL